MSVIDNLSAVAFSWVFSQSHPRTTSSIKSELAKRGVSLDRQRLSARAEHCRQLCDGWLSMTKLRVPMEPIGRTFWEPTGLRIITAPELGLQEDERLLVVKLWLRQSEPSPETIRARQWLMANQIDELLPGGVAAVLDLRRRDLHVITKRSFRRCYELALRADAKAMSRMWQRLAKSA